MQMRLRAELLRQRTFAFGRAPELMVEPILYGKGRPKAECRGTWKRCQNAEVGLMAQAPLVYFCILTSFFCIDFARTRRASFWILNRRGSQRSVPWFERRALEFLRSRTQPCALSLQIPGVPIPRLRFRSLRPARSRSW